MRVPKISRLESQFIPAKKMEGDRTPLLLVMHGLGDSMEGYRFLPDAVRLDSLSYLLVNAPDPYYVGYSWFDIQNNPAPGIVRSREFLYEVLGQLINQGWPADQLGILGFSQGCVMALEIACRYPRKLGAIVGISGFLAFEEQYPAAFSRVAFEQKILVTHGSEDPMLPMDSTRRQIMGLKKLGLPVDWREYRKDHTIDQTQEIGHIRDFLRKNLMKN